MKHKRELFKDRARKWRWRVVAMNGRIVCTAGENFASRRNALRAFASFCRALGVKWLADKR